MTDKMVREIIKNKTPLTRIIEIVKFGNFAEVVGKAGSDTLTYRIYANGTIVER